MRRRVLALVLALALTFGIFGHALAYSNYTFVWANGCSAGHWCQLDFYADGGSDAYDCYNVYLYSVTGSYQTTGNFCGGRGWTSVTFYNIRAGDHWYIYAWDGIYSAESWGIY